MSKADFPPTRALTHDVHMIKTFFVPPSLRLLHAFPREPSAHPLRRPHSQDTSIRVPPVAGSIVTAGRFSSSGENSSGGSAGVGAKCRALNGPLMSVKRYVATYRVEVLGTFRFASGVVRDDGSSESVGG